MRCINPERFLIVALASTACASDLLGQAGSLDPTFNAAVSGTVRSYFGVYALKAQADGKVIIGGAFTNVNGIARSAIARLHADGSVDASFDPGEGADNVILNIVIQPDHKILVGGIFENFSGPGIGLVRLNTDGSRDSGFNVTEFIYGYAVAYHPSGKIYVADGNYVLRLNSDGSVDDTFFLAIPDEGYFGQAAFVGDFAVQPDGKILLCGNFFEVNGIQRVASARLNADGSLDGTFVPGAGTFFFENDVLGLLPDGRVYQAGGKVALLHPSGQLDTNFNYSASSFEPFTAIGVQSDGKPVVGGNVTFIAGTDRHYLARLKSAGAIDESFTGQPNGPVHAIAVQPDGRVLIGGNFSAVDGSPRLGIARLLGDAPIMQTQRGTGTDLVMSWPAAYTNFVVQSAASVPATNWSNVPVVPTVVNGLRYVTNEASGAAKFFRLTQE